ncbi:MAG: flippase-like domain-containing protein [candidate division WOR-3 bacterium]|nr:flippase-like domain-containing protein [candidate division WOR-3 bacterium]MCX7948163.1 flippase-like domain-containing protein [candidate division WOR-3 bacterium]MDW8151028.1 lysylphosphatidylglycerol synthase transmembrane domain-containing protein [candidate division WOR-3 bacterium]
MFDYKKILKAFKIFLIFYIMVSFIFLTFFSGKELLVILKSVNILYFLLGILNWGFFIVLDSLRVLILSRGLGKSLDIKTSVEFITSGSFLALITPFGSGGLPYQIWLLNKFGFSIQETIALVLTRGLCIFIPYLTFLPFTIKYISANFVRIFLIYAIVVAIGFLIFFILRKNYREKLRSIKLRFLIFAIVLSFPAQVVYLSFLFIVLKSLSVNIDYFSAFFRQLIMQISTYFQITPGGLGLSEAISSIIISENIDFAYIGISIVLWRLFTGYLSGFLGFFFVIKRIK